MHRKTARRFSLAVAAALLGSTCAVAPARAADHHEAGADAAFKSNDLTGWKTRDAKKKDLWQLSGQVGLDPQDPKKLTSDPAAAVGGGGTALLLAKSGPGADLITERSFGDCEVHVEFMVPKGSNSGVYLMGQYEVQVMDSFGKKDADLKPGDVGGIYITKAPSTNAAKAPGEWQSFDIVFKAPRFGPDGKKTEDALFVNVKLNGKTIHENVRTPRPTGSELPGGERPTGPLMLQGDHGPVAYRNVTVKPTAMRDGK